MEFGSLFTDALVFATLLGNGFTIMLILSYVFWRSLFMRIKSILSRHAVSFGFIISAAGTIGSLIYSEIVGFPACILCWIQRIFMYPVMFILGLALFRKERSIIPYALLLSIIGGAVALYHWIKDMLALYSSTTLPCPAVSLLPSCEKIFVIEYGYITISMIALNAFILLGIVLCAGLSTDKNDK